MKTQYLLYVINFVELAAAIAAAVFYSKYKHSSERFFLHYLWYVFAIEMLSVGLGYIFRYYEIRMPNFWLFNFYMITMFLFYLYWYSTILKAAVFRNLIRVFAVIFLTVTVLNFFIQHWNVYHKYTFITGTFLITFLTVSHFYQLLNSNQVLIVKYKLSFWISTGLLLFNIGMIPFFLLSEYLDFKGVSYIATLISLNCILYGCYIIGFLWTKKKYNHFS